MARVRKERLAVSVRTQSSARYLVKVGPSAGRLLIALAAVGLGACHREQAVDRAAEQVEGSRVAAQDARVLLAKLADSYLRPPTRRISLELLHDVDLPVVVPRLLAAAGTEERRKLAAGLGRSQDARAVPPLMNLLRDPDVAMWAKSALADLGEVAMGPLWEGMELPLPEAAWPDPTKTPTVSTWCLRALCDEGPRAVPFLLARFRAGDAADRRKALTALRYMHFTTFDLTEWPEPLVSEIGAALDAPDSATRVAALAVLQRVAAPPLLASITARMSEDPDPLVAAFSHSTGSIDNCVTEAERVASRLESGAARAARQYAQGARDEHKGVCDGALARRVSPLLADRRPPVRAAVIEILGSTFGLQARRALGRALAVEAVPALRLEIVKAGVDSPAPLLPLLRSPDTRERLAAIEALGRLGAAEAVPALASLMGDADTKLAAQGALGRIGGRAALSVLIAAYRATPPDERPGRAQLLATIGYTGGMDALAFLTQVLLSPGTHDERWSAAQSMTTVVAGVGAVSRVRTRIGEVADRLAADPDAGLRAAMLELLRGIDDHVRLQAMAQSDPDPGVRAAAARTLQDMTRDARP